MVGKNYTDDEIVNFFKLVADNNIRCLDMYMIYGLPTETDQDAYEFKELIHKLDEVMPDRYPLAIHWNAFTPSAQTPLQWAKPAQGEFKGFRDMLTNTGNKRIKCLHKPKMTNDYTIWRRMLAIRGTEETAQLIYNFSFRESEFKKRPETLLKEYQKITGIDLIGEWPTDKPLPWDKYCLYKKDLMLNIYKKKVKQNK
jgi:radical SAM superfamily enzyme YgiQ (UPF0313 family)